MIVKKKDTRMEKISVGGFVLDYPMKSKDVGISVQNLNGRVPNSGRFRNQVCHEICLVVSGSGKVAIGDDVHHIEEGDLFIIEPNEKSYIQANNLKLVVITRPDWYIEQCETVSE